MADKEYTRIGNVKFYQSADAPEDKVVIHPFMMSDLLARDCGEVVDIIKHKDRELTSKGLVTMTWEEFDNIKAVAARTAARAAHNKALADVLIKLQIIPMYDENPFKHIKRVIISSMDPDF